MGSLKRAMKRRSGGERVRGSTAASLGACVDRLHQLMVEAKNLSDIGDYFNAELVPHPEFMKANQPGCNEMLLFAITHILSNVVGRGTLREPLLGYLLEHGLWSGYGIWSAGGPTLFLYFERSDLGLCMHAKSLASPETDFMRFSRVAVHPGAIPTRGPRGSA